MANKKKVIIMGAAGRDFHNFNVYFKDNEDYEVVAFTATQIPDIYNRIYPPELAGNLYPKGISIYPEEQLTKLTNENISLKRHETMLKNNINSLSKALNRKIKEKKKPINKKKPVLSLFARHFAASKINKKYRSELKNLQNQLSILSEMQKDSHEQLAKLRNENVVLKRHETILKNELKTFRRPRSVYSEIKLDLAKRRQEKTRLRLRREKERLIEEKKRALEAKNANLQKRKKELESKKSILKKDKDKLKKLKKKELSEKIKLKTLKKQKQAKAKRTIKKEAKVKSKPSKQKTQLFAETKIFKSFARNLFKDNKKIKSPEPIAPPIGQDEKIKLLKTKTYQELVEEANKELSKNKDKGKQLSEKATIPVYKHEPFAEHLVRMLEEEEKRMKKRGKLSKNKMKMLLGKKQRVKEKLKKLEFEKRSLDEEEFSNKKEALNHVLDKINNILRNQK